MSYALLSKRHRNIKIPLTRRLFVESVVCHFNGSVECQDEADFITISFVNADDRNNFLYDKTATKLLSDNHVKVYKTDRSLTLRAR